MPDTTRPIGAGDRQYQKDLSPIQDDSILPTDVTVQIPLPRVQQGTRSPSVHVIEDRKMPWNRGSRSGKLDLPRIVRNKTNESDDSIDVYLNPASKRERKLSDCSYFLDVDSHASRSSQQTEEDVCFPMSGEHVRVNGIDFDELEEFIKEELESQSTLAQRDTKYNRSEKIEEKTEEQTEKKVEEKIVERSNFDLESQMEITPKPFLRKFLRRKTATDETFQGKETSSESVAAEEITESTFHPTTTFHPSATFPPSAGLGVTGNEIELPVRFSFFHSDNEETLHAPDIPSLVTRGTSVRDLFHSGEGTWWLDCTCPSDAEMRALAKAFEIHPLTAEDIRMQEPREKVEFFRNYYFICFNTFEPDPESEDHLEPIKVYIVVFQKGVLTFHFSPTMHSANVRRRVRQLREYVDVSADWIGYAMIDDITDAFAPVITGLEFDAEHIDNSVYEALTVNYSSMLRTIGETRRRVMKLMRLLSNKADVIRMFAKRCQEDALILNLELAIEPSVISGNSKPTSPSDGVASVQALPNWERIKPRADIALYLGDIQDHIVTMYQNLSTYEKIFSRCHANYLAQLQVESFKANLTMTQIMEKVTLIGTIFFPLNLIPGLFGMNVTIPGEQQDYWFWGICAFMVVLGAVSYIGVKFWLRRMEAKADNPGDEGRSIRSFAMKTRRRDAAKSILSFPNKYD